MLGDGIGRPLQWQNVMIAAKQPVGQAAGYLEKEIKLFAKLDEYRCARRKQI